MLLTDRPARIGPAPLGQLTMASAHSRWQNCAVIFSLGRTFYCGVLLATGGFAAPAREPWSSNRVTGSPNPPAPYTVERLHSAQNFQNPVDLAFMPRSTRLLVAEQGGKIWSFDTRSNSAARALAIDLRQHHQPFDSILGFTFHPGFATNHFIFINYNEPGGRTNGAHVSRFKLSSLNPPLIDPASEHVVIRWIKGRRIVVAGGISSSGYK